MPREGGTGEAVLRVLAFGVARRVVERERVQRPTVELDLSRAIRAGHSAERHTGRTGGLLPLREGQRGPDREAVAARAKDLAGCLLLVGRVQRSAARIDEYLVARDVADGDGCASTSSGLGWVFPELLLQLVTSASTPSPAATAAPAYQRRAVVIMFLLRAIELSGLVGNDEPSELLTVGGHDVHLAELVDRYRGGARDIRAALVRRDPGRSHVATTVAGARD